MYFQSELQTTCMKGHITARTGKTQCYVTFIISERFDTVCYEKFHNNAEISTSFVGRVNAWIFMVWL